MNIKITTKAKINPIMYQILKQNREKTKYFILFTFIITFSLLLTVVFKNDDKINNKEINVSFQHKDLTSIKEFLLTLIKSPFININYEIKKETAFKKFLKNLKYITTKFKLLSINTKNIVIPVNC